MEFKAKNTLSHTLDTKVQIQNLLILKGCFCYQRLSIISFATTLTSQFNDNKGCLQHRYDF